MSFRNPTPFLKHATSDIVARQALKGVLKAEADIGPRIVFKSASGTVVAELKKENAQMSWERLELKAKRLVEQHFAGAVKYEIERPQPGRKAASPA